MGGVGGWGWAVARGSAWEDISYELFFFYIFIMHNDLINKNRQQRVYNYVHALILPISWFDWVSLSSAPHFSRCHGFGTVAATPRQEP